MKQSSDMAEGSVKAAFTDKRETPVVPGRVANAGHDPHLRAEGDNHSHSHLKNAMKHLASDHAGTREETPDEEHLAHKKDHPGV